MKTKKYMVEVKDGYGRDGEWIEALVRPVTRKEALRIKDKYKKENHWHGYRIVPCDDDEASTVIVGRVGPFILGA